MTTSAIVWWLCQGCLLVAGLECLVRLQQGLGAAARHALWLGAFVALAVSAAGAFLPATTPPSLAAAVVLPGEMELAPLEIVLPALPAGAPEVLAIAWAGWVALHLAGLIRAYWRVSRLAAGAIPVAGARQDVLPAWTKHRGTGRRVALAVSEELRTPAALGFASPHIVLPRHLLECLSAADIDRVVMHELAHLRRRDDWTQLLQGLLEATVGFHPAALWIRRRLALEREAACDAFAVRATGDARGYAACLAKVAASSLMPSRMPALASGAGRSGRQMETRLRRLVSADRQPWSTRVAGSAVLLTGALVLGATSLATSVVAFEDASHGGVPEAGEIAAAARRVVGEIDGRRPVPVAPAPHARTLSSAASPRRAAASRNSASTATVPVGSVSPTGTVARLASVPIADAGLAPPTAPLSPGRDAIRAPGRGDGANGRRNPWLAAGSTIGSAVQETGAATAGSLTRVGRSIASAFSGRRP